MFRNFNLLVNFSANLDPNSAIFDFVDSLSSLLSENRNCPNFSADFIVRFDQISKDI